MTKTSATRTHLAIDGLDIPDQLLIDGQWVDGDSGEVIGVLNPSNGETVAWVADATPVDGEAALAAATAALPTWSATAPRRRSEILRACFDLMIERSDELAKLISMENGKAFADACGEVAYAAEFFRWYSEEAVRLGGEVQTAPSGTNRILVERQPMGVAVLITPWNFPAAMATRKLAPALAAGCTAILKPATLTPLTALAIGAIMAEAGVPAGVVNVLTTSKTSAVVTPLLNDPRVRKLSFTGSTEVGRHLLRQAADQVLSCSMELGGNAPLLVFNDADIDVAVEGAMVAKMRNGGQACTAANRIYVQDSIHDAFASRLAERMSQLRLGDSGQPDTDVGPLVDARSVAKVAELVDDASSRGAKVLVGGQRVKSPGFFFPPTVLVDVPADARIVSEEIFGPVASIMRFDSEAEAIAAANATEYGLAAYVFTSDLARGMRVAEAIESGMVAINRGIVSDAAAPFGGMKQSGLGREGAHEGILEYTEMKYIAVAW